MPTLSYTYIYYIYNLAHRATPTKWTYSYSSGTDWSRGGKGSIQTEVCFLERKKGHMHMTALGFYQQRKHSPISHPLSKQGIASSPLTSLPVSQGLSAFLWKMQEKAAFLQVVLSSELKFIKSQYTDDYLIGDNKVLQTPESQETYC